MPITTAKRIGRVFREIFRTREFWSDVTAALFGTVLAALLGIVIAFWYDNHKRELERSDREITFLERIYCELASQGTVLNIISQFDPTTVGSKPSLNLNMALWDASKGTDYILAVNDPALLNSIAWAYKSLADVDRLITRHQDLFYTRRNSQDPEARYAYAQLINTMKVQADEASKYARVAANKTKADLLKTGAAVTCP